jgi:superfamily II DNA or RNA helicase
MTLATRNLRRQRTSDEYAIYRAALEWDLEDPIVIETRDDFKSEYRWRGHFDPFHHQVTNLITFCRRLPVTLLADDVGLGKTISAGLVMSELIARSRITKVLVVCPKLLGPQWKEELESKFDIPSQVAVGKEVIAADPQDIGAVITTYTSGRLHLDKIPEDRFQMLVLDEAHKLRNLYGVEDPPQVATKFREALEARRFRYVLMLTATPIHNRLWDLYSLVDLLTVARGHQNPFGSEGMFARKFIADKRDEARRLKPEAREEFRAVVYGYMSRVRRGDAKLYFPEREVKLHRVEPTPAETLLIRSIAGPIQNLNRLAQISILQALASSPQALSAQLNNMARNRTVPSDLAATVDSIVKDMPLTAKLHGLGTLIDSLRAQDPSKWRLVIFTTRLQTQATIEAFLSEQGFKVGTISGSSAARNQQTLAGFRKDPPDCRIIVSTEAGAEGVNLQVANVLVNYDLPWNPMIVEQRIGRVQRLASKHAKVGIFNVILKGTFEEYIVGRLMEKLQMATHAIGDIEALLEASGIDGDDEEASFEEKIRQLVVASLSGKDVQLEMRRAEESIAKAKVELEREQATINELLGSDDGRGYVGPRAPKLPGVQRSMSAKDFTVAGLTTLGASVRKTESGYIAEENGGEEYVHFDDEPRIHQKSTLYAPGSPAFARLVDRLVATGIHNVRDIDREPQRACEKAAASWIEQFAGSPTGFEIKDVRRRFNGKAFVRVRATVAHDSYERLVELDCRSDRGTDEANRSFLAPLTSSISDPRAIGLSAEDLEARAQHDDGTAEFCRFYLERRDLEVTSAGGDDRKRKRLYDEFTPRQETTLVGLDGELYRDIKVEAKYKIDDVQYSNQITVTPHLDRIIDRPVTAVCARTNRTVPVTCLKQCDISKKNVLAHLLTHSDRTARSALPEFTVLCALSGKRLLQDEVELSAVTGNPIDKVLLKTSAATGVRAEPEHFGKCQFTNLDFLKSELAVSEISGKAYRQDQRRRSVVSGRSGHKDEFIVCSQTGQSLVRDEAEKCEATGKLVQPHILQECAVTKKRVLPSELDLCEVTNKRVLKSELGICQATGKRVLQSELTVCEVSGKRVLPSVLETCEVTGKRVLPAELERCAVTGKRAIRKMLVTSSISGARLLEDVAIRSATGEFCTLVEAELCAWSGRKSHPNDLRTCRLTGLPVLFQFAGSGKDGYALQPLVQLLDGIKRNTDKQELWQKVEADVLGVLKKGRCQVEAAVLSPTGRHLATSVEVKTMLGLRTHQAGLIYSIDEGSVVGRVVQGQRKSGAWTRAQ